MADTKNPFLEGLTVPQSNNPFLEGLTVPPTPAAVKPMRTEPLTEFERLIFQNLFDTDTSRRRAYAKSIGLELDPKDDNKFRALGSREEFTGEIDPGFIDTYKKGGLKAVAAELGRDVLTDMASDYAIGGLSAAAAKAAAIPSSALGPLGTVVGGLLGGFGGAMAGEESKEFLGDLMLDEEIPADQKQQVLFGALNALGPVVMKQAGKLVKGGYKTALQLRKSAIKEALKQGGELSESAIEKAMTKPELFQPEVVKEGTERLDEFYRNFFGVAPDEIDITKAAREMADGTPKGAIGKALEPVYAQRNKALAELNADRSADFSISELKAPINQKLLELKSKPFLTVDEKEAVDILKSQINEIDTFAKSLLPKETAPKVSLLDAAGNPIKQATQSADISNIRVPYGTGQDFLRSFQSKAFDKSTKSQNPIVNQVAGTMRTDVVQLKGIQANPAFADAQAKISRAKDVFEESARALKPDQIRQSFVLDPKSNRLKTQRALKQIDEITGQDFTKQFEKGALQAQFEQFYSRSAPKGSSEVRTAMVKGAASGAVKGGLGGAALSGVTGGAIPIAASVPSGVLIGSIRGASQAATMARPGEALKSLGKLTQREQLLESIARKAAGLADTTAGSAGLRAVTEEMAPKALRDAVKTEEEETNPFLQGL